MASGASVVVVGGGVMGCSIAFHLAERGAGVLLLEKGTVCSGMTARSGALIRLHYTNRPEASMAATSLGWFRDWRERVGGWCGFTVTGAAVLVGPDDAERLGRNVAMLRGLGVDTEAVAPEDLAAEHPELDLRGVGAVAWEPGSGYADPVATTFAFASRAVELGTCVRPHGGELSLLGVEAGHRVGVDAIEREAEGYDHAASAAALERLAARVPAFAGAPLARGHPGVYDTSPDPRAVAGNTRRGALPRRFARPSGAPATDRHGRRGAGGTRSGRPGQVDCLPRRHRAAMGGAVTHVGSAAAGTAPPPGARP